MLNYLFDILQSYNVPGWRLFGYTSFRALVAIVLAKEIERRCRRCYRFLLSVSFFLKFKWIQVQTLPRPAPRGSLPCSGV